MTSDEAAALYLSQGMTNDPGKAVAMASGEELNLDALQRAHLTRMMGFEFDIKFHPNKALISARDNPKLRTQCKFTGDEASIDRLVEACLRLKQKYERANA